MDTANIILVATAQVTHSSIVADTCSAASGTNRLTDGCLKHEECLES